MHKNTERKENVSLPCCALTFNNYIVRVLILLVLCMVQVLALAFFQSNKFGLFKLSRRIWDIVEPPRTRTSSGRSSNAALYALQEGEVIAISAKQELVDCVVFSCSGQSYGLLSLHMKAVNVSYCDKLHFNVKTYQLANHKEVKPHWCRVAILADHRKWFPSKYRRIFYADVDTIYEEEKVFNMKCEGPGLKKITISKKVYKRREILRTNWFYWCDSTDKTTQRFFQSWAQQWRDVRLQDQTVLNENWKCTNFHCVEILKSPEVNHCGSWMAKQNRISCLQKLRS